MRSILFISVVASLVMMEFPVMAAEKGMPARADKALLELIKDLRKAVDARDMAFVHRKISKQFMLYRDFGGMYSNKLSHIQNFHGAFELDNTRLFPEYRDYGWKKLAAALKMKKFEVSSFAKGEICGPAGAMDHRPYPDPQLCFKKQDDGRWLISSYIYGGD